MTTAQEYPWAAAESNYHPTELQIRSRGGRAVGGQIVGQYRAAEAHCCQCCRCRISRSDLIIEVLTAGDVLEVCAVYLRST
jgi:hypothetical protein